MPSPQQKLSCESDFQELFSRSPYVVRTLHANEGDLGSIPASGRSPGEGNGNPLQYSYQENPMESGTWWARTRGILQGAQLIAL